MKLFNFYVRKLREFTLLVDGWVNIVQIFTRFVHRAKSSYTVFIRSFIQYLVQVKTKSIYNITEIIKRISYNVNIFSKSQYKTKQTKRIRVLYFTKVLSQYVASSKKRISISFPIGVISHAVQAFVGRRRKWSDMEGMTWADIEGWDSNKWDYIIIE